MAGNIFPAPGSSGGNRWITTFSGFDIAPIGGSTTFKNLLLNSTSVATSTQTTSTGSVTGTLSSYNGQGQATAVYPTTASGTGMANTSTGTFTWTAPTGVTNVSIVAVGGGGGAGYGAYQQGAGGGGGALTYANNISVVPGTGYSIQVGAGGAVDTAGGTTWFNTSSYLFANGGSPGTAAPSGTSNAQGQVLFTSSGITGTGGAGGSLVGTQYQYTWTCPLGVSSVSVVAIGGGAAGVASSSGSGGGGGALAYSNNISVTPGTVYNVYVGNTGSTGGTSFFINTSTVAANGGSGSTPGTVAAGTGGSGGFGGGGQTGTYPTCGGGGGAGGYGGAGGNGSNGGVSSTNASNAAAGATGAGGGGGGSFNASTYYNEPGGQGGGSNVYGSGGVGGTAGRGGTAGDGVGSAGGSGSSGVFPTIVTTTITIAYSGSTVTSGSGPYNITGSFPADLSYGRWYMLGGGSGVARSVLGVFGYSSGSSGTYTNVYSNGVNNNAGSSQLFGFNSGTTGYGAGGGGGYPLYSGTAGAVRIIWPGTRDITNPATGQSADVATVAYSPVNYGGGGGGGAGGYAAIGGAGGSAATGSTVAGGSGGTGGGSATVTTYAGGAGGSTSYTANSAYNAATFNGGGAGGGGAGGLSPYGGGGVGLLGQTSLDSTGQTTVAGSATTSGGTAVSAYNGGSGGTDGSTTVGGGYGGGAPGGVGGRTGGPGAIRIMWGTSGSRSYPATLTADQTSQAGVAAVSSTISTYSITYSPTAASGWSYSGTVGVAYQNSNQFYQTVAYCASASNYYTMTFTNANIPISSVSSSYCFEFWIYFTVAPTGSYQYVINGGSDNIQVGINNAGIIVGNGTTNNTRSYTFNTNTWYHIAYMGASSLTYLAINGIIQGSNMGIGGSGGASPNGTYATSPTVFTANIGNYAGCYLSNFRLSTGTTIYSTSGFTVPTLQFTPLSTTDVLLFQNLNSRTNSYSNTLVDAGPFYNNIIYTNNGLTTASTPTGPFFAPDQTPDGFSTNVVITSASTTQYVYRSVAVRSNTQYTFSFYSLLGTASDYTYGVYDNTNSTNIVAPTSYYNSLNITFTTTATGTGGQNTITVGSATNLYTGLTVTSATGVTSGTKIIYIVGTTVTLSANNTGTVSGNITFVDNFWKRISFTFTTGASTASINVFPIWNISSGPGTNYIWGMQLETGATATSYQPTEQLSNTVSTYAGLGYTASPAVSHPIVMKLSFAETVKLPSDNRRTFNRLYDFTTTTVNNKVVVGQTSAKDPTTYTISSIVDNGTTLTLTGQFNTTSPTLTALDKILITDTISGSQTLTTISSNITKVPVYSTVGQATAVYPTTVSGSNISNTGTGTFTWTAPTGVTSVSVVAVGGGGGGHWGFGYNGYALGGGGGGALAWVNAITVVPGNTYTVVAGAPGTSDTGLGSGGTNGGDSYFINTTTVFAGGGKLGIGNTAGGLGGTFTVTNSYGTTGGGNGGAGGAVAGNFIGSGGGGAGGYSGTGGVGGSGGSGGGAATSSGGGGGGAGANATGGGGGGGGVELLGYTGVTGTGGAISGSATTGGTAGSGGTNGGDGRIGNTIGVGGNGGTYGGGAGSVCYNAGTETRGTPGSGAVRLIWGAGRSFPSTSTADQSGTITGYALSFSIPSSSVTNLNKNNVWSFKIWDSEIYPQANVAPTNRKTNVAREVLFYSNMATGIRQSLAVQTSVTIGQVNDNRKLYDNIYKPPFAYYQYTIFPDNIRRFPYQLTKQIEVLRLVPLSITRGITLGNVGKINTFKIPYDKISTISDNRTANRLTKQIEVVRNPKADDGIVFNPNMVAKFTTPNSKTAIIADNRTVNKVSFVNNIKSVISNPNTFNLRNFDNVGLTTGPYINGTVSINNVIPVTGRNSIITSNVIVYYTYDNNIITSIPAGTSVATLYFISTASFATTYPTGSTIRVDNINNGFDRTFTVITSTSTSVSFLDPGDLPSVSGTYISTYGSSYQVIVNFPFTQYTPPYPVNSYVTITNSSGQKQTVLVTAASSTSIAFNSTFTGFVVNGSAVSLASASIEYYPQSSVLTNIKPTNPRENLYYFNIAPGIRTNNSIVQGIQYGAISSNVSTAVLTKQIPPYTYKWGSVLTPATTNLTKFDNVGLTIGPYINGTVSINNVIPVTGRNSIITSNVIVYYTYDNNTITSIPAGTSVATLYFISTASFATTYPTGSTIRVDNVNNNYDRNFIVITSTSTSVSFLDPGDLPSVSGTYISTYGSSYQIVINFPLTQYSPPYPVNSYVTITNSSGQKQTVLVTAASSTSIAFNSTFTGFVVNGSAVSLASASIEYYPQSSVLTNIKPTNPRENLYYFNIAPGIRTNNSIVQGIQYGAISSNVSTAVLTKQIEVVKPTADNRTVAKVSQSIVTKSITDIRNISRMYDFTKTTVNNRVLVGQTSAKDATSYNSIGVSTVNPSTSITIQTSNSTNPIISTDWFLITDSVTGIQALTQANTFVKTAIGFQPGQATAVYPSTVVAGSTNLTNTGTGTFTWTVPTNVTSIDVILIGGGGGGGTNNGGGGGGGSLTYANNITVTPGTVFNLNTGAGGSAGGTGGTSWFNTSGYLFANGGASGTSGAASAATYGSGGGGGSGGYTTPGGLGGSATGSGGTAYVGGAGGTGGGTLSGRITFSGGIGGSGYSIYSAFSAPSYPTYASLGEAGPSLPTDKTTLTYNFTSNIATVVYDNVTIAGNPGSGQTGGDGSVSGSSTLLSTLNSGSVSGGNGAPPNGTSNRFGGGGGAIGGASTSTVTGATAIDVSGFFTAGGSGGKGGNGGESGGTEDGGAGGYAGAGGGGVGGGYSGALGGVGGNASILIQYRIDTTYYSTAINQSSGAGSFTFPSTTNYVKIWCVGRGANGTRGDSSFSSKPGGGAGGVAYAVFDTANLPKPGGTSGGTAGVGAYGGGGIGYIGQQGTSLDSSGNFTASGTATPLFNGVTGTATASYNGAHNGSSGTKTNGGAYGGGGSGNSGVGGVGVVRIIWGANRLYPATLTSDQTTGPASGYTMTLAVPYQNVISLNTSNTWTVKVWDSELYPLANVAPTNRNTSTSREILYYANMAPGTRQRLDLSGIFISEASDSRKSSLLTKQIEVIKADNTSIRVGKTSSVSIIKGDNNRLRADIVTRLKVPNANTQVFDIPYNYTLRPLKISSTTTQVFDIPKIGKTSSINTVRSVFSVPLNYSLTKQIEVVKADNNRLRIGKTSAVTRLVNPIPNEYLIFNPNNLTKQIEVIKADNNRLRADIVTRLRVPNANTQGFDSPLSSNLTKQITAVKGIPGTDYKFNVNNLQKQIEVIKADNNRLRADIVTRLRVPNANTQVFNIPSIGKTSAVTILKSDNTFIRVGKTSAVTRLVNPIPNEYLIFNPNNLTKKIEIIKGTTLIFDTGSAQLRRYIVPSVQNQVFYVPLSSNLTKQITAVKGIPGTDYKFDVSGLQKQIEVIRSDSTNIRADIITILKLSKSTTQGFYAPSIGKTTSVTTVKSSVGNKEGIYLYNLNLQKQITAVKGIPGTDYKFDVSNLQKQIQILKADRSNITVGKTSTVSTVKGDNSRIRADIVNKFNVRNSNTQVFSIPYNYNLTKQITAVKGIPGTDYKFDVSSLQKQIEIIKADRSIIRVDFINILKVPSIIVQGFDVPRIGKTTSITSVRSSVFSIPLGYNLTKQITAVKGIPGTDYKFNVSNLQKQIQILKADRSIITVGKTSTVSTVKGDNSRIRADIVNKFNVRNSNTQVFSIPYNYNLTKQIEIVRDFTNIILTGTITKQFEIVKSDTIVLKTDSADKIKSNVKFQAFYLPKVDKASTVTSLKSDNAKVSVGKTSAVSIVKGDNNRLRADIVTRLRVPNANTQGFDTPYNYNLTKQIEIVRDFTNIILTGSLAKQIEVIKSDNNRIRADIVNKFKVRNSDTQVFDTPRIGKTTSITSIQSSVFSIPSNYSLAKRIEIITGTANNIRVGKTSYISKLSSIVITLDTGSAQIKKYIVPSTTIAAIDLPIFGKTSAVTVLRDTKSYINHNTVSGRMSTFDNVGLTTGPYINGTVSINDVVTVTGRNSIQNSNVIIYYTYDNNTIVTIPAGSNIATLYFASTSSFATTYPTGSTIRVDNVNNNFDRNFTVITSTSTSVSFLDPGDLPNTSGTYISTYGSSYKVVVNFPATQYTPPYTVGTYVTITNSNGLKETVLVTAATNSSIAFNDPFSGFIVNGSAVSLASASVEYYPQSSVITKVQPTNPRENLYYFNIAPGYRAAKNTFMAGDNNRLQANVLGKTANVATLKDVNSYADIKTTSGKMATFDNVGLTSGPITTGTARISSYFPLVGRNTLYTSDVLVWYSFDNITLTTVPVGSSVAVLYFQENTATTLLYPTSSLVRVVNNNGYDRTFTVISSTSTSVSFLDPGDLPSTSGSFITNTSNNYPTVVNFPVTQYTPPYPVGTYVTITNSSGKTATVNVLAASNSAIAFTIPFVGFITDNSTVSIANASIVVYPRSSVYTNVPPTNSREILFYTEIAPGYRPGIVYNVYGIGMGDPSPKSFTQISVPTTTNREVAKVRGLDLNVGILTGKLQRYQSPTFKAQVFSAFNSYTLEKPITVIKDTSLKTSLGSLSQFKTPKISGQVFTIPNSYTLQKPITVVKGLPFKPEGIINQFIVGRSPRRLGEVFDVAFVNKVPIQFWN